MKRNLLSSLLAGVVLFIWSFFSWAVLPWHNAVANQFSDEVAISQALKANAPRMWIGISEWDKITLLIGTTSLT